MGKEKWPRMTLPTQLVLRVFLDEPTHEMYGLRISTVAGLASGTVHPILARLENLGWLESRWEDLDPAEAGRPRRRFYRLTPDGAQKALTALARARVPSGSLAARVYPGLAPGGVS